MRNFQRIAVGIDVGPLLLAIQRKSELWNQHTVRTHHPESVHRVVDDIVLRYNRFEPGEDFVDMVCSRIDVVNYPAWAELPQARKLIFGLMSAVEGEHLGRVFLSRMRPGVTIPPHSDRIAPAEAAFPFRIPPAWYYSRYHVVLVSEPGVVFNCGDETAYFGPGEAFWFNNQLEHSVVNNSANDRIHLVVDIHGGGPIYQPKPLTTPAAEPDDGNG